MKKYNNNIILGCLSGILIAVMAMVSSCKKLIEIPENPPSQLTANQVFADSTNITGAIAGIYNNIGAANYGIGTSISSLAGIGSDELRVGQYSDPATIQFFTNNLLRDNYNVNSFWTKAYSDLYQINACIEGLSSTAAVSATSRNRYTAEARVVRAFYYFNLVNLYGGIPLVLSTDYKLTAKIPRASVDQVYTQIISDLTQAQAQLTDAYPSADRARVNINVAKALLAKVYLYRGNYQNAQDLAGQVIASGIYRLVPELDDVFLMGSEEAIWQLPANGQFSQTSDAQYFVPYSPDTPPDYPVSDFLVNSFESGDLRLQKWIGFSDIDADGSGQLVRYYYPFKYKNREAQAATTEGYMVLRLADLYLIRAEAEARLNKIPESQSDLDAVRLRAGLNPTTASTPAQLIAAILHERQDEMFCEWGNRWFDLKRSGTIDAVLGSEKTGWKPTSSLYPIPQEQLRLNPFLTQNSGY